MHYISGNKPDNQVEYLKGKSSWQSPEFVWANRGICLHTFFPSENQGKLVYERRKGEIT
jgi:hypothetical protein